MGKGHYPPIKPHKPPVGPTPPNPHPQPAGVPLIWWTENEQGRLTDAGKANVGIATLIIQRDNGSLWRVTTDKAPYTWVQINVPGDGKPDPYKTVQWKDVPEDGIQPWTRVIVTNEEAKTFKIASMGQEDSFEIVDLERLFAAYPVTLIPPQYFNFPIINIDRANLVLDTIGQGSTWRFIVVGGDIVVDNVP